jgi:hypothetical protein
VDRDVFLVKAALVETADDHEERDYLGMSGVGQCPLKLYNDLVHGRSEPSDWANLLFHEGYVHEEDIIARLGQAGHHVAGRQRELVAAFDSRVRGHIDGEITLDGERVLLEIKSVNPEGFRDVIDGGAFDNHRAQVQAYMRFGGWKRCLVIYKNRENGQLWIVSEGYDAAEGSRIERKLKMILEAVDNRQLPECTCGQCWG